MNNTDHDLYNHIAECLGLQGRKVRKLELTFEAGKSATIRTEELVGDAIFPEVRHFRLSEVDACYCPKCGNECWVTCVAGADNRAACGRCGWAGNERQLLVPKHEVV